jgi:hypothetical protein
VCANSARLYREFTGAVQELTRLLEAQAVTLMQRNNSADAVFEEKIKTAAERRTALKAALMAHLAEHRC